MSPEQLEVCRQAARIVKKRWPQLEFDEALSVAVVTALEHPRWWTAHTASWIRQSLVSYCWAELVRKPIRMAHAEQRWYEGLVPPASKQGREHPRRCKVEGHVRGPKRCNTCNNAHNQRYRRKHASENGQGRPEEAAA